MSEQFTRALPVLLALSIITGAVVHLGMGLSLIAMVAAALGHIPPIAERSCRRASTSPSSSTPRRHCGADQAITRDA